MLVSIYVLTRHTGDGVDDYIFIDTNGALTAYVNGGPKNDGSNGWIWYPQGINGVIATGIGSTREQIQLADINGKKPLKRNYFNSNKNQ